MELAEILQQWGPAGLMLIGLIYVFVNGSKMQLANANALSNSNRQWASMASQQQLENEGLSARNNEYVLQNVAQQTRILKLSERTAAIAATNTLMEQLHKDEREKWFEKDAISDKRVADLERDVADNKRTISELKNEKQAQQETIAALEVDNVDLKAQVKRANEYGASRDKQIDENAAELKALEKRAKDCEDKQPDDDDKTIQLHEKKPPLRRTG